MRIISLLILCSLFFPGPSCAEEREHTIIRGDTLHEISEKYYGKPELWPRIWEKNAYIRNPDLIYPNNKLMIPGMEGRIRTVKEPPAALPAPAVKREIKKEENEIVCAFDSTTNSIGFDSDGYIIGGDEVKTLFSYGDYIFIDAGSLNGVKPFTLFSVWRRGKPITPPYSETPVAVIMKRVGTLKVTRDIEDNTATAFIIESREPIQLGDLIKRKGEGSEENWPKDVKESFIVVWKPVKATFDFQFDGYISELKDSRHMAGFDEKVYLDLGRNAYADEGSIYTVYRKGKHIMHPKTGELVGVPIYRVGFVQVTFGPKGRNTAVVRECKKPVMAGDMVKKWKGASEEGLPWEVIK